MSEEKQIEEMAKVIETTEQIARDAHCGLPSPTMYAKDLYWHGYRKQSEGRWMQMPYRYRCSECGDTHISQFNYCPNCGAKMKGGA